LKGDTGVQGFQGNQGNQGNQGLSIQGSQGLAIQGPQGNQGSRGFQGLQGPIGLSIQGPQGASGLSIRGYQGFQGFQGNQGPQGERGYQGTQGNSIQGSQGDSGQNGLQGAQGLSIQGAQGPQGAFVAGPQGNNGLSIQGPQGSIGQQGPQGSQGHDGSQGYQGQASQVSGPQGERGYQGNQGVAIQGPRGFQGYQGLQGFQGYQGQHGTSVNIKGSYSTLLDLQNAHPVGIVGDSYIIGTHLYVWLISSWEDVGIIQGPQGVQGIQGKDGYQGIDGVNGLQGPQGSQGQGLNSGTSIVAQKGDGLGGLTDVTGQNDVPGLTSTSSPTFNVGTITSLVINNIRNKSADTAIDFMDSNATFAGTSLVNISKSTTITTAGGCKTLSITPTYNSVGGPRSYYDIYCNRTETSIGTTTQRLISLNVASVENFGVDNKANVIIGNGGVGTSAQKVLSIANGTAPVTAITGTQIWSETTGLKFMTTGSSVVKTINQSLKTTDNVTFNSVTIAGGVLNALQVNSNQIYTMNIDSNIDLVTNPVALTFGQNSVAGVNGNNQISKVFGMTSNHYHSGFSGVSSYDIFLNRDSTNSDFGTLPAIQRLLSLNVNLIEQFGVDNTGKIFASSLLTNSLLKGTLATGEIVAAGATDITGQLLTGYVSASGTVAATDSILQGIQKINGNVNTLKSIEITYSKVGEVIVSTGSVGRIIKRAGTITSGTVAFKTAGTTSNTIIEIRNGATLVGSATIASGVTTGTVTLNNASLSVNDILTINCTASATIPPINVSMTLLVALT
jgi:hypothetical protein